MKKLISFLTLLISTSAVAGSPVIFNGANAKFLNSGSVIIPGLTPTTVPYLDSGSTLQSSSVTPTELGYVHGVTSSIQTQLNAISGGITALTGDVTASGPGSASATVNSVGGSSAASINSAATIVGAATASDTASTLVLRDSSKGFATDLIYDSSNRNSVLPNSRDLNDTSGNISVAWQGRLLLGTSGISGTYIDWGNALLYDSSASLSVDYSNRRVYDSTGSTIQLSWSGSGVELNQLTASTVPVLNSSKVLTSSSTTSTELGYVHNVTSAIQTQLNAKQSSLTFTDSLVNTTGTVTLVGDSANPGDSVYYGTDSGGTLGYYSLPSAPTLYYQTVESNGSAETQRSNLNFSTNFGLTDVSSGSKTTVDLASTISSNTSGTAANITATSNTSLTSIANLATVGTIGTGTWEGTKVGALYGGTGIDTSSSSGIPLISGGTWSVGSLSGNTTTVATASGILISGHCVEIDSHGNFVDNGSACGSGGSGVSTVGTFDSQTAQANGLYISGSNIYAQSASSSNPGMVNNTTQTFSGAKTFSNNITLSGTGNTVGTITSGTWNGSVVTSTYLPTDVAYLDAIETFSAAQTFSAQMTNSVAGVASTPALIFTGSPYAAGSATTNEPQLLLQDAVSGSTAWSSHGTYIGVNAKSAFTGHLLDLQLAGTSDLSVDYAGNLVAIGTVVGTNIDSSGDTTGTATNTTNVDTSVNSTNASFYPLFVSSAASSNQPAQLNSNLSYNPSTATLTTTTFSGALSGNATTATTATNSTNVATTATNSSSSTFFPTFVASSSSGNQGIGTATGLTWVPSTGALTATTFVGALTGHASLDLKASNNLSDVSTAATAFNNISPMTALGDTIYGGASGAGTRLAGSTSATLAVLTQTGTGSASAAPVWTTTTGTGDVVLAGSPTLTAPALGTPTALVGTNITGTGASFTAGTATNATNVATTATNSSSSTFFPAFVASSSSGNQGIDTATGLTWVPSTGTLTATTFSGALSGNASTSTTATNATNIATTATNSSSSTFFPTFVASSSSSNQAADTSSGLTWVPSTGALTATTFVGALTGHASSDLALTGGTMSGAVTMGSNQIHTVTDPTSAQDAATKNYVDTQLAQLNPAAAVYAASTANVSGTYTNAVSGVCIADTFQTTATTSFALDGTSPALGARVLLKNQTSSFQDGVWTLTTQAVGSVSGAILTRAPDSDSSTDLNSGQIVPIQTGTVNAGASYYQTAVVSTCNTDSQTWTQFQKASSAYLLSANNLSDVGTKATAFNNISPMTTLGDIEYENSTPSGVRLAGNTTSSKEFLSQTGTGSVSAAPVWGTLVSGDIPNNAANTSGNATTATTATNSTNAATTATNSSASTFFPAFVGSSSSSNQGIDTSSGLTWVPSTGTLTATTFSGALNGNASTVTTNANLSGPIASSGNTTSITAQTGTGTTFAMSAAPAITGAWTLTDAGTIINATTSSKVLAFSLGGMTASKTLTIAAAQTNSETLNIPNISGSDTLATLGLGQTFTGANVLYDTSTIVNSSTTSKVLAFNLAGMTASKTLTIAAAQTNSETLNVPNITASDTIATLGLAETFSGAHTLSAAGTALTVNNNALISGTLAVGTNTTTNGTVALATSVGSGQSITLQNGGATTAYTFDLPITVGSAGQPLLSSGSSSSAQTWGTLSGNTTTFGTTSGTLTSGDCVSIDSHGNFVDSGGACGGGGGSGTVTSVAFTVPASSILGGGVTITTSGTIALTTTGTSGGIPYFSSTSQLNTSAALTQYGVVIGGGAGAAPYTLSVPAAGTLLTGVSGGNPAFSATPTLGVNTSTAGTLSLATSVGSGQSIVIRNQGSVAGYNFDLPLAAGSSGQVLTWPATGTQLTWSTPSGGGGSGVGAGGISTVATGTTNLTSSNYGQILFCNTSTGIYTFDLPAPASTAIFTFKDTGGQASVNAITLVRNASEKIEGIAASYVYNANWGSFTLASDGTNWFIITR